MNDVCGHGGSWLETARGLPVAFAQVREDPLLDLEVVRFAGSHARVAMVASGGCTAALLGSVASVGHVHLVDPNPAQLALTRLKLRLLKTAAPGERLALLGHAAMAPGDRKARLVFELAALDLARDTLGADLARLPARSRSCGTVRVAVRGTARRIGWLQGADRIPAGAKRSRIAGGASRTAGGAGTAH